MPIVGTLHDFVPNTTILSADVEADFAALRTAINTSAVLVDVARTISVTHTHSAAQNFAAGSVGAPGIYLAGNATSGIYQIAANNIGVAISAAKVLDIAAAGLAVTGTLSATGAVTASSTLAVTGAATLSSTLAVTGAVTLSGTLAVTGVSTLSGDVVAAVIRRGTVDGADNSSLYLSGGGEEPGGGLGIDRGAFLHLAGNEHPSTGTAQLAAGNVAGGVIEFYTGGSMRGGVTNAGVFAWTGAATIGGTLGVTGTATTRGIAVEADSTYDIGANAVRYANIYGDALFGTLGTAAQPNITSVGTLSSLTVSGALATDSLSIASALSSLSITGALSAGSLNLGGATITDILTGTATFSGTPTINDNAEDTEVVTVIGAAVGDVALVTQSSNVNVVTMARVIAPDSVSVSRRCVASAGANMSAETLRIFVIKV
jgi:hypothetical protein